MVTLIPSRMKVTLKRRRSQTLPPANVPIDVSERKCTGCYLILDMEGLKRVISREEATPMLVQMPNKPGGRLYLSTPPTQNFDGPELVACPPHLTAAGQCGLRSCQRPSR
ncbi:hypothetical protein GJ744_005777 [Endocarpon pusillum]|uniref:Uncharacterized protein n=1 Tax=Endocarpon pusillum TaxID=364733 RepID=A0A8H7AMX5_9EURO|nr:hypothetical protein GJ744_005777 [Endocarpon pusillum]